MADFFELAGNILPQLLTGLLVSLELAALALTFGGILGILLALCRVYGRRPAYLMVTAFIELIRGTPLLVQLFILYFGLPEVGITISGFLAAVIAFSVNTAAYQAEYFRGAIQAIDTGQMEAARSIGMSQIKAIFFILLPQALRLVIPAWSNEAILLIKFTSLAFMVTVPELMSTGRMIATRNFRYLEVFFVVALVYLITVLIFTKILDILESKLRFPGMEMR